MKCTHVAICMTPPHLGPLPKGEGEYRSGRVAAFRRLMVLLGAFEALTQKAPGFNAGSHLTAVIESMRPR